MSLSVGGLISGMDTDNIISQLIDLQKKPITKLQQQEAAYQVKLSSYGSLQGHLKDIKNAARNLDTSYDITSYAATSTDTSLMTVSAERNAQVGTYSVTVNSLAKVHKLTSGAFTTTEAVGKGTINLQIGDSDIIELSVNASATISDIARAINDQEMGVYASVISDGTNSYLTLTGQETGEDNVIQLTVVEDGTESHDPANLDDTGLSRLLFIPGGSRQMSETQVAGDADITVDGVQNIKRSSNTITDVITGVTLKLKDADIANPVTVAVERSDELFTTRLNAFLSAYNDAISYLNTEQKYDKQTQETGSLFGDSTTRRIQREIQSLFSNSVPGMATGLSRLSELGVETNADGSVELDTSVFNEKLKNNFTDVVNFFTQTTEGAEGFAVRMAESVENMLDITSGTLTVRTKGIQSSIDEITEQIERLNTRLTSSETRLRAQFASLEVILGQYQTTSNSLTQSLSALENGWGTSK
ncbi:MAG: flagellar filament capping protein FliD [Desulfatirhabdiaceae bacterium]